MDKKYYTAENLAEIITYIDKREKPYTVRAARSLLAKESIENIDEHDNSEEKPAYLKCKKPYYYSIENICKALTRKYKRRFSLEDVKTAYHRKKLIEKERKLVGEAEYSEAEQHNLRLSKEYELEELIKRRDYLKEAQKNEDEIDELKKEIDKIQQQYNIYKEQVKYYYDNDDPCSYENMVQPYEIKKKARKVKLEIILEKILEELGYRFDEEKFYSDLIAIKEVETYHSDTEMLPLDILEKKAKIANPKKYYIKEIDKMEID